MPSLPSPTLPAATEVPVLRWGVIGTGIAEKWVHAVRTHTSQQVVAVTARDRSKTHRFAAEHGIASVFPNAAALVRADNIDAVYVATPHPLHRAQALAAIAAGKHVLIEKPIAMSAAEASEITAAGRAAGVLVMEAMWTRYLPQSYMLRQLLERGAVGDVHLVTADFGFTSTYDPSHRLWAPELGGGALLDAGVYPISFVESVLGRPSEILTRGTTGPGGVDTRANLLLSFPEGAHAAVATSLISALPVTASVIGSEGRIDMLSPFFGPSGLRYTDRNKTSTEWTDTRFTAIHDGLSDQVTAFASYVGEGRVESPVHTHESVSNVMRVIDDARAAIAGN